MSKKGHLEVQVAWKFCIAKYLKQAESWLERNGCFFRSTVSTVLHVLGSMGDETYRLTPHYTTLIAQPAFSPYSVSPWPPLLRPPPSAHRPPHHQADARQGSVGGAPTRRACGRRSQPRSHTEAPFPGLFDAASDEGGDLGGHLRGYGSDGRIVIGRGPWTQ
jgi:hypothetical protein